MHDSVSELCEISNYKIDFDHNDSNSENLVKMIEKRLKKNSGNLLILLIKCFFLLF